MGRTGEVLASAGYLAEVGWMQREVRESLRMPPVGS